MVSNCTSHLVDGAVHLAEVALAQYVTHIEYVVLDLLVVGSAGAGCWEGTCMQSAIRV